MHVAEAITTNDGLPVLGKIFTWNIQILIVNPFISLRPATQKSTDAHFEQPIPQNVEHLFCIKCALTNIYIHLIICIDGTLCRAHTTYKHIVAANRTGNMNFPESFTNIRMWIEYILSRSFYLRIV